MASPQLSPEAIAILERLGVENYRVPSDMPKAFGPLGALSGILGRVTALRQLDAANAARLARQRTESGVLSDDTSPSMLGRPRPVVSIQPGTSRFSFSPTSFGSDAQGSQTSQGTQGALHPRFVDTLIGFESSGNPRAVTGSFRGLGQFSRDLEARYGITDWTDPNQQRRAITQHGRYLAGVLRRQLGREPTPGEIYLAHQQGEGGAPALLTASPGETAFDVLMRLPYYRGNARTVQQAIQNNLPGNIRHRWRNIGANEFANVWVNRFNSRLGFVPVVTSGSVGVVQPTARSVRTLPVGPGGQANVDGMVRLGGLNENSSPGPVGQQLPSGPELAPEQDFLGAPSGGLFVGAPTSGNEIRATAGAPIGTTAGTISTGQAQSVQPPREIASIIEQSIPGHPERIQQIQRLFRTLPMTDVQRQELMKEHTELTKNQTVDLPNVGRATYTYDRRQGRFVLDSFQSSASVQTITAGGTTTHGILTYDRSRGWRIISPHSPSGNSNTQADELGIGPPPTDPAGLAAWNLRLQTLTKDVEDNAAQRRTIISTIGPLSDRISTLQGLEQALARDDTVRGVGSQFATWWRRMASQLPEGVAQLFTNLDKLPDRELMLALTQIAGVFDQTDRGPTAGMFAGVLPQVMSALTLERPELAETAVGARMRVQYIIAQLERQRGLARHLQGTTRLSDLRDLQARIDDYYKRNPIYITAPASGNAPQRRILMQAIDISKPEDLQTLRQSGSGTWFFHSGANALLPIVDSRKASDADIVRRLQPGSRFFDVATGAIRTFNGAR